MSGFLGKGLIDGMVVTAKNFVGSYFDGDKKEKLFTYQYPEEKMKFPENSRTFPFLVYDDTLENMRCVACKICEIECPPQCIYIVMDRDEKGKPVSRPKVFDIDLSVCMECGICAEVCPFEAIKMDCDFEYAKYDRFEPLVARLPDLLKPNEYYQKIKPREAAAVDAKLKAEAEKKAAKKTAAPAPKPVAPAAPPPKPAPAPADVLSADEKKAWEAGYLSPIGAGEIVWPPVPKKAKPAAGSPVVAATTPVETTAPASGDWPWHDQALDLKQRMELAKDRPVADKLMAAMAQTDCRACGYDCRGYADAIAADPKTDLTLCLPGEEETKAMLEKLLKEAGKA